MKLHEMGYKIIWKKECESLDLVVMQDDENEDDDNDDDFDTQTSRENENIQTHTL